MTFGKLLEAIDESTHLTVVYDNNYGSAELIRIVKAHDTFSKLKVFSDFKVGLVSSAGEDDLIVRVTNA